MSSRIRVRGPALSAEDEAIIEQVRRHAGPVVVPNPVPYQRNRLTSISVACIIANRMIGTGIFNAPTSILRNDHNIGTSLMLWFAGCCATLAGTFIYTEYGLSIPRFRFDDNAKPRFVPRNGGELVYLNYILATPQFLATCLFGIPFILLGNSAANALSFGYHFLFAIISREPDQRAVIGIAILTALVVCGIHGTNRRYGIILNNIVAILKVLVLLMIFVLGCAVLGGKTLHRKTPLDKPQYCSEDGTNSPWLHNFNRALVMKGVPSLVAISSQTVSYGAAYLQVIFTFGGWNQANYVLGEVRQPHARFRRTSMITVGVICVLYMLVNFMFLAVVPIRDNDRLSHPSLESNRCAQWNIASEFFRLTCGSRKVYHVLLAFSSIGNIIVTTFTAARVKQEIAKEGILPFFMEIANDYNVTDSIKRQLSRFIRFEVSSDRTKPAPTPAVALILHFIFTTILILATWRTKHQEGYIVLVNLYSFVVHAFFAACLGVGILAMRAAPILKKLLRWYHVTDDPQESWNTVSSVNILLSSMAALLMATSNSFPLVEAWRHGGLGGNGIPSHLVPALGVAVLGLGAFWWLGFYKVLARGRTPKVIRKPILSETHQDPNPEMIGEQIQSYWVLSNGQEVRRGASFTSATELQVLPEGATPIAGTALRAASYGSH